MYALTKPRPLLLSDSLFKDSPVYSASFNLPITPDTSLALHLGSSGASNARANDPLSVRKNYHTRYTMELNKDKLANVSGLKGSLAISATTDNIGANFIAGVTQQTTTIDRWKLAATALYINHNGTDALLHGGVTAQRDNLNAGIYVDSQRGENGNFSALSANFGYNIIEKRNGRVRLEASYIHNLNDVPDQPRNNAQVKLSADFRL